MRKLCAGIVLALVLVGCHAAAPPSRIFQLGPHRIVIAAPDGCEVLDQGRTVRLRKGEAEVAIEDMGPAGSLGIGCEVAMARELWRQGRVKDALWRMRRLPVPDDLFTSAAQRDIFWARWSEVSDASENADPITIDRAFQRLLKEVEALKAQDLQALVDAALAREDRDRRRDVASRRPADVGGRQAIVVDTWDRLTHSSRQRVVFVFVDGYLMALRTEGGPFLASASTLDEVIEPLRIL